MCDILSMQCAMNAHDFGRFAWRTLLAPMKNHCTSYYYNRINVVRTYINTKATLNLSLHWFPLHYYLWHFSRERNKPHRKKNVNETVYHSTSRKCMRVLFFLHFSVNSNMHTQRNILLYRKGEWLTKLRLSCIYSNLNVEFRLKFEVPNVYVYMFLLADFVFILFL